MTRRQRALRALLLAIPGALGVLAGTIAGGLPGITLIVLGAAVIAVVGLGALMAWTRPDLMDDDQ